MASDLFNDEFIIETICQFLPPKQVLRQASVNSTWSQIADSEDNWKRLVLENMTLPSEVHWNFGDWKQFYKSRVMDTFSCYAELSDSKAFKFGTDDFTLSSWIYVTSHNSGFILAQDKSCDAAYQFRFELEGSGALSFVISNHDCSVSVWPFLSRVLDLNRWYYVAVVRQGTKHTLYVDGSPVNTCLTTIPVDCLSSHQIRIGTRVNFNSNGPDLKFPGYIKRVGVWRKALTDQEILLSMFDPVPDSQIAFWNMGEGDGGYLRDSVGNLDASILNFSAGDLGDDDDSTIEPAWVDFDKLV